VEYHLRQNSSEEETDPVMSGDFQLTALPPPEKTSSIGQASLLASSFRPLVT